MSLNNGMDNSDSLWVSLDFNSLIDFNSIMKENCLSIIMLFVNSVYLRQGLVKYRNASMSATTICLLFQFIHFIIVGCLRPFSHTNQAYATALPPSAAIRAKSPFLAQRMRLLDT